MSFIRLNIMRESSEIPKIIFATFGVLITNVAIFAIGVFLAINTYNTSLFIIPALSSAGISITQLIYVIPTLILLRRRQQNALEKGVVIGAVITALLNGGCYLILSLPR